MKQIGWCVLALVLLCTVVVMGDAPLYCTVYTVIDGTFEACTGYYPLGNDVECGDLGLDGVIRCTAKIDGYLVWPPPTPFVSPIFVSPLYIQAAEPTQEPLDHCFAFGFPCTDYNPGAQEGCVCFCDMPKWCPN